MRFSLLTLVPLLTTATAYRLSGVHAAHDIEIKRSARGHFEKRGFGEAEDQFEQAGREVIGGFKDIGAGIARDLGTLEDRFDDFVDQNVVQNGRRVRDGVLQTVDGVKQVGNQVMTKVSTAAKCAKNRVLTEVEEGVNDVKEFGREVDRKFGVATGAVVGVTDSFADAIQDSEKIVNDAADTISGKAEHRKLQKRFLKAVFGFTKNMFGRKGATAAASTGRTVAVPVAATGSTAAGSLAATGAKEVVEEGVKTKFKKTTSDKIAVAAAGLTIGAGGVALGTAISSPKPDVLPQVANGDPQVISFRPPQSKSASLE